MNCKRFESLIPDFVDKKMDYATTRQFLEHQKNCTQCREELNIQFLVNEGLVRLEEGEAFDLQKEMFDLLATARKKIRFHERLLQYGRMVEIIVMIGILAVIAAIIFL